jgi:predicted metal-dependent hydrolase
MAVKKIELPELGTIHLYRRRRAKSMRLSVTHAGDIRVSLPYWAPYKLGVEFAQKRKTWLLEHRTLPGLLRSGQTIGKAHRLLLVPNSSTRITTRIASSGEVKVLYPLSISQSDPKVQAAAERASIRALKLQSESLLPQRLRTLAAKYGFNYSSVDIKRLSSRWGSCSSDNQITLNCYLMQLPWHLIDYVLLHELTHTKIMAHGAAFWAELSSTVPDIASTRKEMKQYQPRLFIDS